MTFGFGFGFPRMMRAAAVWTPADLSGLALWLDADDASTITLNGSNVSQWADKSGNGRNASQATAASQPAYTASGLNGKPVITFGGSDQGFVLGGTSVPLPRDIFLVDRGGGYLFSANTTTERIVLFSGNALFWSTASPSAPSGSPVPRDAVTDYIEAFRLQADGSYDYEINAASIFTGGSRTWTNNNAITQIGLKWAAPTGIPSWAGIIAEIIWTDTYLSLADKQKVEGYLAWKWGLEASLPAGHPYKTTPPTV